MAKTSNNLEGSGRLQGACQELNPSQLHSQALKGEANPPSTTTNQFLHAKDVNYLKIESVIQVYKCWLHIRDGLPCATLITHYF